tara:strand:- start:158 stop:349 length:192 start_codon:yes stop_codon:yes gene_type:complete
MRKKIVTKKMERNLQEAVKILFDVRNEILKNEEAEGIKGKKRGNVLRFKLDQILDDLEYYKGG